MRKKRLPSASEGSLCCICLLLRTDGTDRIPVVTVAAVHPQNARIEEQYPRDGRGVLVGRGPGRVDALAGEGGITRRLRQNNGVWALFLRWAQTHLVRILFRELCNLQFYLGNVMEPTRIMLID